MSDTSDLGQRMKRYERASKHYLTPRMPLIIRIDGRTFHSYTKGFKKPWDVRLRNAMTETAKGLIEEVQGAKIAYLQSDEISLLINDYETFSTTPWFDKNIQKIASVSASIATAYFNNYMFSQLLSDIKLKLATFDSRCFTIPREDVCNYFWWRQIDATRNSISGLAQANFTHNQLYNKNKSDMHEMLFQKGINWNDLPVWERRGWTVIRKIIKTISNSDTFTVRHSIEPDWNIPKFSERDYINQYLKQIEE